MNWTLIPMHAPEELIMGYTPSPRANEEPPAHFEGQGARRFFVTLFVVLGLLAGLQSAFADDPPQGQRRLAELSLSERKAECRTCGDPLAHSAKANF